MMIPNSGVIIPQKIVDLELAQQLKAARRLAAKEAVKKGKVAEDNFQKMVSELIWQGHLPWIIKLQRATYIEDRFELTDFKIEAYIQALRDDIIVNRRFDIRINIKSSLCGAETLNAKCRNPRRLLTHMIYPVIMDGDTTPENLCLRLDRIFLDEIHRKIPEFPDHPIR